MNATSERVCVKLVFHLYSNMAAMPVLIYESQCSSFITRMQCKIIYKDSSQIFRKCFKVYMFGSDSNRTCIQEAAKSTFGSGNACYN